MERQGTILAAILAMIFGFATTVALAADDAVEVELVAAEPVAAPLPRASADQLLLDSTSIRGNQELPRVMYIVPWKDPQLGDVIGKPVNSLVDEILAPVDRDVFRRQTKYFDQLYGSDGSGNGE